MLTLRNLATSSLLMVVLCSLLSSEVSAQTPQSINYQAVARDTSGEPLNNRTIDVQFTIIDSVLNTAEYQETWSGVVTNRFGLFSLQIGAGASSDNFEAIDWSSGSKYLQVNIDGVDMGNATALNSVPYALYAENAGNTMIIDSAVLVGTDYTIYTNKGNVTSDMSGLIVPAGLDTNIVSGSINGSNLDLTNNAGQTISIDISTFLNDTSIVSGAINGSNLDLTNNEGQVISIDISALLGDTSIVSGAIVGSNIDLINNAGQTISIDITTLIADTSITSGSIVGSNIDLINNVGQTISIDISSLLTDTSITSGSIVGSNIDLINNAGQTISIDISSLLTDTSITSGSIVGSNIDLINNAGQTISIDISSLLTDTSITSGSIVGSNIDLINNAGQTISIDISSLLTDTSITSGSIVGSNMDLINNAGQTISIDISSLLTDTSITSGSIVGSNIDLINNAGQTISIDISSLLTDTSITSGSIVGSNIDLINNAGQTISIDVSSLATLTQLGDTVTFLNDSIDQVANDLSAFIANNLDSSITNELVDSVTFDGTFLRVFEAGALADSADLSGLAGGSFTDTLVTATIVGTQLALEDNTGDTIFADISTLATLTQLGDTVTFLNDSIDQVANDLSAFIANNLDSSITNELVDSVTFDGTFIRVFEAGALADSADLSGLAGGSFTDTLVTATIVGTQLALEDNTGDTIFADISTLATLTQLGDTVTFLNDSIDQVASDLAGFIAANLDSAANNELVDSVTFDGTFLRVFEAVLWPTRPT